MAAVWRAGAQAAALLAILLLSPASARADAPERPNIFIFAANCLDRHLGAYGYGRGATPNLDRFAREALVFRNLVAPATFTPPCLYELLTSSFADHRSYVGIEVWRTMERVPAIGDTPLGARLARAGYRAPGRDDAIPPEPFFFMTRYAGLHHPYDPMLKRRADLTAEERAIYDRAIADVTRFVVVPTRPADEPAFSYMAFDFRRAVVAEDDPAAWDGFLAVLRGPADALPARVLRGALSPGDAARLSAAPGAATLSPGDRRAIVDALNRLLDDPAPLIEIIEAGHFQGDRFVHDGLPQRQPARNARLDWLKRAKGGLSIAPDGRIRVARRPNEVGRLRIRLLSRAVLEMLFPALNDSRVPPLGWVPSQDAAERERQLALLVRLYDANIGDLDREFGRRLGEMKRRKLLDRTVVVFVSEHGEAFMEHGMLRHGGVRCYDELINPPLIVRAPGGSPRGEVRTQLRMVDVFPTALDLGGLGTLLADAPHLDGTSILPAWRTGAPTPPAFSHNSGPVGSVRTDDGWKLIWDVSNDGRELYNLRADPGERRNVFDDHPEKAGELEPLLSEYLFSGRPAGPAR